MPCPALRPSPQSAPVAVTVITYIASSSATQGLLAVPYAPVLYGPFSAA